MVDLNADLGTIVKQLLGKGGAKSATSAGKAKESNPLKSVIMVGAGVVIATALYVQVYYLPRQKALAGSIARLEETKKMKGELEQLKKDQKKLTKQLADNHDEYMTLIHSFGVNGKIEDLYSSISLIASAHDLTVANIHGTEKDTQLLMDTVTAKTVNVELQGRFQQYAAFREELIKEKPVLDIKSEAIEMGGKGEAGMVTIRLVLLDYSIDRPAYEEVLNDEK